MEIAIGLILAIVSLAVVVWPFFKRRSARATPEHLSFDQDALDQRVKIYQEMKTIQLDYDMGNIDEAQYKELMNTYRLEAASLIQKQHASREEVSKTLEEEIKALKESGIKLTDSEACPKCSYLLSPEHDICPLCHYRLDDGRSPRDKDL